MTPTRGATIVDAIAALEKSSPATLAEPEAEGA